MTSRTPLVGTISNDAKNGVPLELLDDASNDEEGTVGTATANGTNTADRTGTMVSTHTTIDPQLVDENSWRFNNINNHNNTAEAGPLTGVQRNIMFDDPPSVTDHGRGEIIHQDGTPSKKDKIQGKCHYQFWFVVLQGRLYFTHCSFITITS